MAFIKKGSPVKINKIIEMKKTASGELEIDVIRDIPDCLITPDAKLEKGKEDA